MADATPRSLTAVLRRCSFRFPRPLWIGLATVLLVVTCIFVANRQRAPIGMTLEFAVASTAASDVDVAPDGSRLAVSGVIRSTGDAPLPPCVFDLQSRKVVYSFPDGADNAAWSPDGTRIAVAVGMQIVEYEVSDGFTPVSTVDVRQGGAGSLTYDRSGNLFACTDIAGTERFTESQVFVWWRRGSRIRDDWQEIRAMPAGSVRFVSTASVDGRLRLVIAHDAPLGITVFSVTPHDTDERDVRTEFFFPDYVNCWIRLSQSGEHLAILSSNGFRLYDLRSEPPSLTHAEAGGPEGYFYCQRQPLDISLDGRRVAFVLHDRLEVRSIRNGDFISSAKGKFACVSLSGNGCELAAIDVESHSLCFYKIPQGLDVP